MQRSCKQISKNPRLDNYSRNELQPQLVRKRETAIEFNALSSLLLMVEWHFHNTGRHLGANELLSNCCPAQVYVWSCSAAWVAMHYVYTRKLYIAVSDTCLLWQHGQFLLLHRDRCVGTLKMHDQKLQESKMCMTVANNNWSRQHCHVFLYQSPRPNRPTLFWNITCCAGIKKCAELLSSLRPCEWQAVSTPKVCVQNVHRVLERKLEDVDATACAWPLHRWPLTTWWKCSHSSIRRLQLVDVTNLAAVHTLLQLPLNLVVDWVKVRTVDWPQSWSDEVRCMHCLACSVGRSVVLPECLTAVCNAILETE